jgi:hypothetical protein
MKLDFAPVLLMTVLAVTGYGRVGLDQTAPSQADPRTGQTQDSAIRWQFDTHG